MLLGDLANPAELNLVDADRAKELEPVRIPDAKTIVRKLDLGGLPQSSIAELHALVECFGREVEGFYRLFETRKWRGFCEGHKYRIMRGLLRKEHRAEHPGLNRFERPPISKCGLQGKHWKIAMQAAAGTVNRYWFGAISRALEFIMSRRFYSGLNIFEQRYVRCLLKSPSRAFFEMMDGRTPHVNLKNNGMAKVGNAGVLCAKLRSTVRKMAGKFPRHGKSRSCWFDPDLYSVHEDAGGTQYIELATRKYRGRIRVPLKGAGRIFGTIVLVRKGGEFFIHVTVPVAAPKNDGSRTLSAAAFDLGFTEAYVDDRGNRYGDGLGKLLACRLAQSSAKQSRRSKLAAVADKSDTAKKNRIRRFNLGRKKIAASERRHRLHVLNLMHAAANRITRERPAGVYVIESMDGKFDRDSYSRRVRGVLSEWAAGELRRLLIGKATGKGIRVIEVPAAYTSMRCPHCGFVHRANRTADRFVCRSCGYTAHADANGAVNILLAAKDHGIHKLMGEHCLQRFYREEHERFCRETCRMPAAV